MFRSSVGHVQDDLCMCTFNAYVDRSSFLVGYFLFIYLFRNLFSFFFLSISFIVGIHSFTQVLASHPSVSFSLVRMLAFFPLDISKWQGSSRKCEKKTNNNRQKKRERRERERARAREYVSK